MIKWCDRDTASLMARKGRRPGSVSEATPLSHLQLNKAVKKGRLQLGRSLKQTQGEGQIQTKLAKFYLTFCLERYNRGGALQDSPLSSLFVDVSSVLAQQQDWKSCKENPLWLDLCPYCLYLSLIKTLSRLPADS